jgi:hypothetical protein
MDFRIKFDSGSKNTHLYTYKALLFNFQYVLCFRNVPSVDIMNFYLIKYFKRIFLGTKFNHKINTH